MNTNKVKTLLILILGFIYIFLIVDMLWANGYVPYHEDETINFDSGKLFYETNSLQAPFCVSENVSPIFHSNWYGFFYNLFYGLINKIFGVHTRNIIVINILLLIVSFLVIKKTNISIDQKKSFYLILLLIPNVIYFLFGFWPVIINLFLAIVLIRLLYIINEKVNNGNEIKKDVFIYFILCCIFILVNPYWAIWTFGILPFSKNLRGLLLNSVVVIFNMLLSFLFIKFFCAQWITGTTTIMFYYLFDFQIWNFLHLIKTNLFNNIQYFYTQNILFFNSGHFDNVINQIVLVLLLFLSPFYYLTSKNKLFLSFSIISGLIFFVLFTIYTAEFEYFQRILTPVYVLLLFCLIVSDFNKLKNMVIIILIISFPISLINSKSNIDLRKELYNQSESEYKVMLSDLRNMGEYMDANEPAIVQWAYFEYGIPRSLFFMNLSLKDKLNRPIIYTTRINCFNSSECDVIDPNIKFKRYGKLKVNYALSKNPLNFEGYQLVVSKQNFNLYKINY